ncbi:MAG: hypothetical protein IPK19_18425 [Chloroflexi bacterium]|nr:hypothetical protein [Chloroflexota bacterium]
MPGKSPFADDWRECLRAHYQYVVRANDRRTLETLTRVLNQVGFEEDELSELYVRATMHVDDAAEDFTPDMTVVAAMVSVAASPTAPTELIAAAEAAAQVQENPPEAEAVGAEYPPVDAYPPDEAEPSFAAAPEAAVEGEDPPYDPAGPQQMSLF